MRDGKLWGLVGSLSLLNSIGTFQAYLDSHRLHAYSSQEMGWIFNVFTFLTFFCGAQIGAIFDARPSTAYHTGVDFGHGLDLPSRPSATFSMRSEGLQPDSRLVGDQLEGCSILLFYKVILNASVLYRQLGSLL